MSTVGTFFVLLLSFFSFELRALFLEGVAQAFRSPFDARALASAFFFACDSLKDCDAYVFFSCVCKQEKKSVVGRAGRGFFFPSGGG